MSTAAAESEHIPVPPEYRSRRHPGAMHIEWLSAWEMQGRRRSMEDRQLVIENVGGNSALTLLALFDGHGGKTAAVVAEARFADVFARHYHHVDAEPTAAEFELSITATFTELHEQIIEQCRMSGCTALVALVMPTRILIANLGDSRAAALYTDTKAILQLTVDHNTNNLQEVEAVRRRGHFVAFDRVDGRLAITRALGDADLAAALSRTPDVVEVPRENMKYLLLSCDGLWESMIDSHAAAQLTDDSATIHQLAENLTNEAFACGSYDNISLMLAKMN